MENMLNSTIPFQFNAFILGDTAFHSNLNVYFNKYQFGILISAGRKTLTRHWLQPDTPTIVEWKEIINDLNLIEKITFSH